MRTELEELCRQSFHSFLTQQVGIQAISWEEGEDPPDYYITINNKRFLVEATTLMENTPVGDAQLSESQIISSLWEFVDKVKDTAISRGILCGTYIVAFQQPLTKFSKLQSRISKELLKYIEQTRAVQKSSEQIVYKNGRERCSIIKIHNEADDIHKSGPNQAKSESQANLQAINILKERLEQKARILRRFQESKILILYDAYRFTQPGVYTYQASAIPEINEFHTVFVVRGDNTHFLMYSLEKIWQL